VSKKITKTRKIIIIQILIILLKKIRLKLRKMSRFTQNQTSDVKILIENKSKKKFREG